jgi:hypothetical protein
VLPPELQTAPPRRLPAAGPLFNRNRGKVRTFLIGADLAFPLVLGLFWLRFGEVGIFAISAAAGLSALSALFAFAFHVQTKRGEQLFREGVATLGRVRRMQAPADRGGNAYALLQVEFEDAGGRTRVGQFTTVGHRTEFDAREGAQVPVLYLPGAPQKCAIYTPGFGVLAGVAKA